jgi:hypothetical protein
MRCKMEMCSRYGSMSEARSGTICYGCLFRGDQLGAPAIREITVCSSVIEELVVHTLFDNGLVAA